ncbi:MAG: T9SS type A sorting domain-containing protein [Bacteroidetes bacterium]|nr:T9SS type A sorting domain-containing protein [Bacteroidota bacterium]
MNAAGFSTTLLSYVFRDVNPSLGNNYYRLKQVDRNGIFEFSDVRVVNFRKSIMNVYPNPVTNGIITFSIDELQQENIQVQLMDLSGKIVATSSMWLSNTSPNQFNLEKSITSGVYMLELTNAAGNKWYEKIMLTQ